MVRQRGADLVYVPVLASVAKAHPSMPVSPLLQTSVVLDRSQWRAERGCIVHVLQFRIRALGAYSHSIVAGGFEVISYTTRLISCISLTMRWEIRVSNSGVRRAQSAVIKSPLVTARMATTLA